MDEQIIIEIENLVAGQLPPGRAAELRERIKNEAELAKIYQTELELKEGIIRAGRRKETKEHLREVEAGLPPLHYEKAEPQSSARNWKPLMIAASLVLVFSLYFVMNNIFGPNPEKLYESYYEPYSAYSSVIKRGSEVSQEKYDQAMAAYESGDFADAAEQFSGLPVSTQRNFYLAQSHLASGDAEAALPLFLKLEKDRSAPRSTVLWYLAMAELKLDKEKDAEATLQKLAEMNSGYHSRAEEILEKL